MASSKPTILTSSPTAELRTWDTDGLLQRLGGDVALAIECVDIFCADAASRLAELTSDLERGATDRLARQCHSLKGAAGTVGAQVFELAAAATERAVLAGDVTAAADWMETMRRELAQLQVAGPAFRAGRGTAAA